MELTHTPPSVNNVRAKRALQSLRFGMTVALLNALFWGIYYAIVAPSEMYFAAITLAIALFTYVLHKTVSYNVAALTFFFSCFIFLVIASLYNPPTPEIIRSQHLFFLPFAIYAYALFYNKSTWFRGFLSSACIISFLFFSMSNVALVSAEELGVASHIRVYGTWFNIIMGAVTFAGMIHYVHSDLTTRDNHAYKMDQAVFEKQLELYYQPQVNKAGGVIGAEALLRWKHPTFGVLTPDKFIPYAEKSGSIVDIGKWVVDEACRQLAIWKDSPELSNLRLSVNISAREFQEDAFVSYVKNKVSNHDIDTSRLKLEITESSLMHDLNDVISKIRELNEVGINFSLDDLGTGYSTLSLVKDLPVSEIKIDRGFVSDITGETVEMPVTDTLISLGESMKVDSVAEGIETKEQWEYLTRKGCQYFQGYFFGKPMEIHLFNQYAHQHPIHKHHVT